MRLEDKIFRVDPAEGNDPFLRSRAALSDFPFWFSRSKNMNNENIKNTYKFQTMEFGNARMAKQQTF